jgi:hypothetical protein
VRLGMPNGLILENMTVGRSMEVILGDDPGRGRLRITEVRPWDVCKRWHSTAAG